MSTTWFTSDHHFGHTNIIKFCQRPFADVDHMNAVLANNWREVVHPDDDVWLVGDVAMGAIDKALAIVDSLPGHKHLVVGNHDRCFEGGGSPEKVARWTARYLEVFETVQSEASLVVGSHSVTVSHFPYSWDYKPERGDRFSGMRPADHGGWLVCGHVHDAWLTSGRQVNVGVDVWDYRPASEAQISAIIDEADHLP